MELIPTAIVDPFARLGDEEDFRILNYRYHSHAVPQIYLTI